MKIKTDFVTNSSSTSYILNGFCFGYLDFEIKDLSILFKKVLKGIFKAQRDSKYTVRPDYLQLCGFFPIEDNVIAFEYDRDGYQTLQVNLEMTNQDVGENEGEVIQTLINITFTSSAMGIKSEDMFIQFTKQLLDLIIDNSGLSSTNSKFQYVQVPTEMYGDGWYNPEGPNCGGPYNFPIDMLREETIKGLMRIGYGGKIEFTSI
jgi:hypothetical protein